MQQTERMDDGKHRSSHVHSGVFHLIVFKLCGIMFLFHAGYCCNILFLYFFLFHFFNLVEITMAGIGQITFHFYHIQIYAT